ncbi:MAG: PH domain-containing protein [Acidimicrobiales bacterium]|jgi:membrane protein YdbS with pleckstrin-like domain
MAFPESYLHDNEDLVLNLKPHWWTFIQPVAIAVGAVVVAVVFAIPDVRFLPWVGWFGVLAALVNLAIVYGKWAATYFVLTGERLIFRTGVLSKRGVEIPLNRINNVNFHQSLFERIIGAGDLLVESAGESGQSRFSNVRKPDAVQNEIYRQTEGQRVRGMGGGQPVADATPAAPTVTQPGSATQLLEELGEMRQSGLITEAEYESKRRDLLDRM